MKRSRLYGLQLLIDGLLLLFSFYLFYYIKKRELVLREPFESYLFILLGVWLVVTVLSKKFYESEGGQLFIKIRELFYVVLKIGALVTVIMYLTDRYHLSRVIVYGSLGLFLILEVIFVVLWVWLGSRHANMRTIPHHARLFLIELFCLPACFSLFYYLKQREWHPGQEEAFLFFIIFFLWFLIGTSTHQFQFQADKRFLRAIFPFWRAEAALFLSVSFLFFFFKIFSYSRFITVGTIAGFAFLENVILTWIYVRSRPPLTDENDPAFFHARRIEEIAEKIKNNGVPGGNDKYIPPFSTNYPSNFLARKLGKLYLGKYNELYHWIQERIELTHFDILEAVTISTANPLNLEMLEDEGVSFFLNVKEVNDIRHLNYNFIQVNQKLKSGGVYIGCFQDQGQWKSHFYQQYPFIIARIVFFFHFIFKRVMSKMPLFRRLYFAMTRGRNRVLSKAEAFGRLYYCGFSILDIKVIGDFTWYMCKKVSPPREDKSPSYGPLIKMKRLGKGGKIIEVYKFRTMHPYSEYLQSFITDLYGYDEKGKVRDDFRVTRWGKFLRRYWLDELPQLINLVKGELRLVGPRPLSPRYFENYPEDIKEERSKYKPGCVPPYVAYRMQGLEGSIEAERLYFINKKKHPFWADVNVFFLAIFNILFHRIGSE